MTDSAPPVLSAAELAFTACVGEQGHYMRLELVDDKGVAYADFTMNPQTAEAICYTLAMWLKSQQPVQTAPTSTTVQ